MKEALDKLKNDGDLDSEDEDDEDDEEFMRSYRDKRLQELKSETAACKPRYGEVKDVDLSNFTEEVDDVSANVAVLVHLYEPSVSSCVKMNRILSELCCTESMVHRKFLRMKAGENNISVDRVTLPIITMYKGGDTVTVLAGIAEELGEHFKKEDVEWLLESTLQAHNL